MSCGELVFKFRTLMPVTTDGESAENLAAFT